MWSTTSHISSGWQSLKKIKFSLHSGNKTRYIVQGKERFSVNFHWSKLASVSSIFRFFFVSLLSDFQSFFTCLFLLPVSSLHSVIQSAFSLNVSAFSLHFATFLSFAPFVPSIHPSLLSLFNFSYSKSVYLFRNVTADSWSEHSR